LLKRIFELSTEKDDFICDTFAGSGTTGAVAHKMNRKWVLVEMGRQADELVVPRLQRIIDGNDKTGISKDNDIMWNGGGGFKYYKLGESLIQEQDMNWRLKSDEMAEAIFLHYQYKNQKNEWFESRGMYLGKHRSAKYHFGVTFASRDVVSITQDLYEQIVETLEVEKFKHLTIFTNVAVSVPPDVMDDRILVKKIPASILREYKLL
jgi:adenine-specific DNA-methyltransferase